MFLWLIELSWKGGCGQFLPRLKAGVSLAEQPMSHDATFARRLAATEQQIVGSYWAIMPCSKRGIIVLRDDGTLDDGGWGFDGENLVLRRAGSVDALKRGKAGFVGESLCLVICAEYPSEAPRPHPLDIWLVSTCMGKLECAKASAASILSDPNFKYVIVDWSCPDHAADWFAANLPSANVVRVNDKTIFKISAARNAGSAIVPPNAWMCFLDCDMLVKPGFVEFLSSNLRQGCFYVPDRMGAGLTGTLVVSRRDFLSVGCYDERFEGYGWEDYEIKDRLRIIGLRQEAFPAGFLSHIRHADADRTRFFEFSKQMSLAINGKYVMEKFRSFVLAGSLPTGDELSLLYEAIKANTPPRGSCPSHLGGHRGMTNTDEGVLAALQANGEIRSMLDLGCGPGGMVALARARGIDAVGVDGDPTISFERLVRHDFTKGPINLGRKFDLIWSVEFVEHVKEMFLGNVLSTIQESLAPDGRLFMTAAKPGQPGYHHVNLKDESYWVSRMQSIGLALDEQTTALVRRESTMLADYVRHAGLVFATKPIA